MKKEIYILIGLVAIFSLVPVLSARAAAIPLENVTATPSNTFGGYIANYTIGFTNSSSTEVGSTIVIAFPAEFNVASAASNTTISGLDGIIKTSSVSGQAITLTRADGNIVASNTAITVGIGTIVNPTTGGSFTVTVKTFGADGTTALDTVTTSAAFSLVPGRRPSSHPSDRTPPNSYIASPTDGLVIPTGEKYAIKGTAQDEGGSSVQDVEISLDGGNNWSLTEIKGALDNVFSWEYVWQNPTKGEYVIKVRATDSVGNIASPSAGVKVTVATPASVPPTVSPEKPITEMTAQELEAKIVEVQQKIIDVLGQLIQLFQQQIQGLLAK